MRKSGHRDAKTSGPRLIDEPAPATVGDPSTDRFPLAQHLARHNGFPIVDWPAVEAWRQSLPESSHAAALASAHRGWLLHFRDALAPDARLFESSSCWLLSSYDDRSAEVASTFVCRAFTNVVSSLGDLVQRRAIERIALVVFDDVQRYYEYVSHDHPEEDERGLSGGCFIRDGSQVVTWVSGLASLERVVVHELTHACLAHRPLPIWLNEGLAQCTTDAILGRTASRPHERDLRAKHAVAWDDDRLREFWSGRSFTRPDDRQPLSYDLARLLVASLASDWARFERFSASAHTRDGGAAAAREHLGRELDDLARATLSRIR